MLFQCEINCHQVTYEIHVLILVNFHLSSFLTAFDFQTNQTTVEMRLLT